MIEINEISLQINTMALYEIINQTQLDTNSISNPTLTTNNTLSGPQIQEVLIKNPKFASTVEPLSIYKFAFFPTKLIT